MITGFRYGVNEISPLMGFYAAWIRSADVSGKRIGPIFKGQAVYLDCLTLENGTDRLSRKRRETNHECSLRKIPEVRTRHHIFLFPVLNVQIESLKSAVHIVVRASVVATNDRLFEAEKYIWSCSTIVTVGRGDSVGVATHYRVDSPGIESRRGRDFQYPYRPALGPSQSVPFPGVKWQGCGVDHPPPSSAEVQERTELYVYFPTGPS